MRLFDEDIIKFVERWRHHGHSHNAAVRMADELETLIKSKSLQEPKAPEPLVEALEEIVNPLKYMQDDLKEGEVLNGIMAIQLSDSAAYLKEIARKALSNYKK